MFRLTQYISSFLWLLVVTVVSGQDQSFNDILANNSDLSALNGAINSAGLNITKIFANSSLTLFAPNNAAFSSIGNLLIRFAQLQYRAHIKRILDLNMVKGEIYITDLKDGQMVATKSNENLIVTIAATTGNVTLIAPNSNATIITPDIPSSNGVIHITDSVLLPKFIAQDLLNLTNSIEGYTIFIGLLKGTGLESLIPESLTATIFAPSDEAFMVLGNDAIEYYRNNTDAATTLLAGHIVTPQILPTYLMRVGTIEQKTYGGLALYVDIANEDTEQPTYFINNATISEPDMLAINGIIHGISSVLVVPGAEYPPLVPTVPDTPTSSTFTGANFNCFMLSLVCVVCMIRDILA